MSQEKPIVELVRAAARAVAPRVRSIREDIHAHPELRFQETRTAGACARELEALGIEVRRGVGGTGVVGVLRGAAPGGGGTVALRAEMDALAMDDRCEKPYASTRAGVAHLCGHDGHVAVALGAAMALSRLRSRVPGVVKFLFEPAEEATPAGCRSGAEAMIADGALEDPKPDAVFGGHFFPDWPAGSIALRAGSTFSGVDHFRLAITGREAHSAVPSSGVDAIVAAAHVIAAIQALASRELSVDEATSITFGTINGGRAPNLLAERVELAGTVRISSETLRDSLPARFERVVKGVCDALGATCDLQYRLRAMPPVVSTRRETAIMAAAAGEALGRRRVIEMRHPRLAADTMHNWLRQTPGVFFMMGSAGDDPATQYPSHHPRFDIAPEAYPAAVSAIVMTAIRYLEAGRASDGGERPVPDRQLRRRDERRRDQSAAQ